MAATSGAVAGMSVEVASTRGEGRGVTALRLATVVIIGWGALAFGAVYPWAYAPLLVACAALGVVGLLRGTGIMPVTFAVGLALAVLAALLQLVPMPRQVLETIAPAGHRFLNEYSVPYAFGGRGQISISPGSTALGIGFLVAFALLALGLARLLTRTSARAVAHAIVAVGYVLGVFGVMNRTIFTGKIYGFWVPVMSGSHPFGPFVNRNHFAGWMVMAIPVALGLFLSYVSAGMRHVDGGVRDRLLWFGSPQAGKTILVGFGILVMTLSLVLTLSRSGIIAVLIAFVMTLSLVRTTAMGRWRVALVLMFLVGTVMLVASMVGAERIQGRFAAANPETIGGRVPIWQDAVHIASDFFPFGSGLNTFGIATLRYQRSVPGQHLAEAHNEYLQLAAEGGLLLGVPILVAVVGFARGVRARLRTGSGSSYWLRVGALTGIAAVAMQSIVEFSLQMPGNAALFAVLCGLALHRDGHDRSGVSQRVAS